MDPRDELLVRIVQYINYKGGRSDAHCEKNCMAKLVRRTSTVVSIISSTEDGPVCHEKRPPLSS